MALGIAVKSICLERLRRGLVRSKLERQSEKVKASLVRSKALARLSFVW